MTEKKINKSFLIILLGILAALGPFTIDMYLPAFSRIAEKFLTDENTVAFTLTSYFIGIALSQLFYGPLVDKYGRKKPMLFGLLVYLLSSLGIAWSFNIEWMIGLRFFQALGGSAGMVASTAIITDVYEPDKRARAFSLIMLVMGIAPIIAPGVGSFFLTHFDWEAVFYFLALFSGGVFLLIYLFLPETALFMHSDKIRIKSVAADYLSIFKNRTFFLYTLGGSLANSMIFAYIASAAYIFMTYYGLSKGEFSVIFGINAIGIISGSYLNGLLTRKINYIKIVRTAVICLMAVSFIFALLTFIHPEMSYKWVIVGIVLIMFCIGFTYPNAIAASLAPFTAKSGAASALGGSFRMLVSAVVTAVIGLLTASSAFLMFIVMSVLALSGFLFLNWAGDPSGVKEVSRKIQ